MTRDSICLCALVVAFCCFACAAQGPGRLTAEGFASLHADYRVAYAPGHVGTFVGDRWVVDNFAFIRRGKRKVYRRGPEWSGPMRIDVDGDGSLDDIGNAHLFDLHLRRDDGAILWVRRVPLPQHLDQASLPELGRLYARDVALGRDAFVGESLLDAADARDERDDVRLIDETDLGVSGYAARGIVVRATRPPPDGERREAYVLVQTPFAVVEHSAVGERRFSTLMVVGYAGSPDETTLTDLGRLLDAIRIF